MAQLRGARMAERGSRTFPRLEHMVGGDAAGLCFWKPCKVRERSGVSWRPRDQPQAACSQPGSWPSTARAGPGARKSLQLAVTHVHACMWPGRYLCPGPQPGAHMSERAGFLSIRRAPRGPVLPGRPGGWLWPGSGVLCCRLPPAGGGGWAGTGSGGPAPGSSCRVGWGGVGTAGGG